jgi:hypothetical protein
MRFNTKVGLAAAILCLPLSSIAAHGWNGPQFYPGSYPYPPSEGNNRAPIHPPQYRPRAGYDRPQLQASRWNNNAGRYRFRSWQPPKARRSMESLSYWGAGATATARGRSWDRTFTNSPSRPLKMAAGTPVRTNPFPMGRYRFRPLQEEPHPQVFSQPRYLPLQVPIADRYVFRPLNPVTRPAAYPRVAYQRPVMPQNMPAWRPMNQLNPDPRTLRSYPHGRYVYGGYPTARPAWQRDWSGRGLPVRGYGQYPAARRVAQRMPGDYRFRPLAGMPAGRPWVGDRWAPRVRREMPPMPSYLAAQYAAYGQRRLPPAWAMGYPPPMRTVYRPESQRPVPKRYGTDWYDGHGDGDGAWYKLAGVSWPTVTQQNPME